MYAIFLATVFNPMESETEMIVTKECTKFDFTCTTVYGCEIAAMGKRTTEKFSKGTKSLFLEQGESTNEYICPGLSEALDIAPRAAVRVADDVIQMSFEHEGFGYFGGERRIVYQVNLTNMRLAKSPQKNSQGWIGKVTFIGRPEQPSPATSTHKWQFLAWFTRQKTSTSKLITLLLGK